METDEKSPLTNRNLKVTSILDHVKKEHPDLELHYLPIKHYDRADGIVSASVENSKTFAGECSIAIALRDGKTVANHLPGKKTYEWSVLNGIVRLHFATFGGLALKTIYFFLAMFTCFVIISGVLLWKEARNKKNYTDRQKRFHRRVTMWYLAICFGLFPAVAILFSAELLVPDMKQHVFYVRTIFFVSWLMLAGRFSKTEAKATRFYLFLGGLFSVLVPLTNGITTGDWTWKTFSSGNQFVAGTDMFWLITGVVSLFFTFTTGKTKIELPVHEVKKVMRKIPKNAGTNSFPEKL